MKQYAASPIIQKLIEDRKSYFVTGWQDDFYNIIWNIDTAQGFGLDIWGRIVVIGRDVKIPQIDWFGFNAPPTQGWQPFNQGAFYPGPGSTDVFTLADRAYRVLILVKALTNISATDNPSLNRVINQLFQGRGRAYVNDLGSMSMRVTFEFALEPWERSVLSGSGVFPRPSGVGLQIAEIPIPGTFGFAEQGAGVEGFNNGTFLNEGNIINAN